jgi:hypothetical protein
MTNLTCRAGCRTDWLTFPPVFRARHNDGRNAKFPLPAAIARKWRLRMTVVTGMAGGAEVPDGTPVIVSDGGVGVGEATARIWRLADGARSCLLSAYRTGTHQRPHINTIIAAAR